MAKVQFLFEKFEEHLTDQARVNGQLKAIIEIGEPIEIPIKRERGVSLDPLTAEIKTRIEAMLDQLQGESQLYRNSAPDSTPSTTAESNA